MYRAMKSFLSIFLMLTLTACSLLNDNRIQKNHANIDQLKDENLRKIALESEKNTNNILLLLPLSGTNADLGEGILNSCILAASSPEFKNININLIVIDTADRSLDKNQICWKFKNNKLKAIIGPVFSTEAKRYGALFTGVPIFTFSNNLEINNNHIFACGLPPQKEIDEIFLYLIKRRILNLLAILPEGKYGDEIEQYLKKTADKFNFDTENDIEIMRYSNSNRRKRISTEEATKYVQNSGKNAVFVLEPILNVDNLSPKTFVFTLSSHALQDKEKWKGYAFACSDLDELSKFSEIYKSIFRKTPNILDMIGYDITRAIYESANDFETPFVLENKELSGCLGNFIIEKDKGVKRELRLYVGE